MDRFRIHGPEISVAPFFPEDKKKEVFKATKYKRQDGRASDALRPVFIQANLIPQAKGSVYFEAGQTKLACSIYGPRQLKKQAFSAKATLICDFKFATFSCTKRKGWLKDNKEKEMSSMLEQALAPAIRLESYPKAAIEVFVTVIENGGTYSCLAAAITAASTALATAGIEMVDIITACSAVYIKDSLLLDATEHEEDISSEGSTLLVALMPSLNLVTHIVQSNHIPSDVTLVQQGIQSCVDGCCQLHSVVTHVLKTALETPTDSTPAQEKPLKLDITDGDKME
ncbi:3'-5'-exoribonuclease [Entomophthora muscae]|uniref:3'-5'-exoribonuclease n=1 Tax=Entomophthora muscae TaxID=34485 RepID=A0ACC2TKZ5_9FUNG|nr:3'-5'-exoribonuclease [Entomophthora muscae]